MSDNAVWTKYAEQKPPVAGMYRWRVPHYLEGLVVEIDTEFRERNAGYERAVSPSFDWWDGYRLHLPDGIEWSAATGQPIGVVGHELVACRFCESNHKIEALSRTRDGYLVCAPRPNELNDWRVTTCAWAQSPSYEDPRKLIAAWNAKHGAAP